MVGFEIAVNGQRLCTAAAGETGVLSAAVTWVYRKAPGVVVPSELRLDIGGLTDDNHLRWPVPRQLSVGDEVRIRLVETNEADPPAQIEREEDRAFFESEERKYYERLKLKYEGK